MPNASIPGGSRSEGLMPCWEILDCKRTGCEILKRGTIPCWRRPDACCSAEFHSNDAHHLRRCARCVVFKVNGDSDPRGWGHFLSDQAEFFSVRGRQPPAVQQEEGLLQILNNLPIGLFTTDADRRIRYFNATAEQITGISSSEALGMFCSDIFRSSSCETDCPLAKAVRTGKQIDNREFVVNQLGGGAVPVICSTYVLNDEHGRVTGAVEVFKDISDRKRLEDDLRLSESKYRRIFEGSKDMIFIVSGDGRFKDINEAGIDLLGYENKRELVNLPSIEATCDNPMHWWVFKKQIDRNGFVKDFEAAFKKRDGTRIHGLLSGNAVRGIDGEIIGYEGIVKDVTARMDAVRNLFQRHRELSLLNSVAVTMNMTRDLGDVLSTALNKVLEVLNVSSGGIFLIDHERGAFTLRAKGGFPRWESDDSRLLLHDEELMDALLKENLSLVPEPTFPPFKATLKTSKEIPPVDLICFLITAKEKASGFLALDLPPGRGLTEQDLHLLGSLGNFLGGAIENARLLKTIQKHREELKKLTASLFQTLELERKRIAQELHDEAGQALTGINFILETMEKGLSSQLNPVKEAIGEVKKQINRTYEEMRRISYRLHPTLLSDLGLEPALDSYLSRMARHSRLEIDFKMVGFEERIDPQVETILYRISQEALTNTLKHARAKNFKISIIKGYPHIIFLAEDDGIGFDPHEFDEHKHALGLLSMRERAVMLGGNFSLRSSKGRGTRIRIEIPIKEPSNEQEEHQHLFGGRSHHRSSGVGQAVGGRASFSGGGRSGKRPRGRQQGGGGKA